MGDKVRDKTFGVFKPGGGLFNRDCQAGHLGFFFNNLILTLCELQEGKNKFL